MWRKGIPTLVIGSGNSCCRRRALLTTAALNFFGSQVLASSAVQAVLPSRKSVSSYLWKGSSTWTVLGEGRWFSEVALGQASMTGAAGNLPAGAARTGAVGTLTGGAARTGAVGKLAA